MKYGNIRLIAIACLASAWSLPATVSATTITIGSASPLTGSEQCQVGYPAGQCAYQSFATAGDLAFSGGAAAPAVVSSTIGGYDPIHAAEFANDGNYGNGRSWIGSAAGDWLKIDLGFAQSLGQIAFGRDRLGYFDDRDPGQFTIEFATTDAIFADGDATDDATEYGSLIDSSAFSFSGVISGSQTVLVDFSDAPINARYIKMTFANAGVAIDEVEVFAAPEPTTLALLVLGMAGIGFRKRGRGC